MTWITGRWGQALALAAPILFGLTVWLVAVQPVVEWYANRSELIAERNLLADRMGAIVATLPALRQQVDDTLAAPAQTSSSFPGASNSIASAMLQEQIQAMATAAATSLSSVETLPAEPAGVWRRIGVRVALAAPLPELAGLLQALDQATPQMLVDDLQIHTGLLVARPVVLPLQTSFIVYAFRSNATQQASRQ